jgi:outer membrane protein assembly factor BamE (lipoprotein component of BamABCDE complex)
MRRIAVCLAMLVFVLGCATAEKGRSFDNQKAQQIEVGKTTEAEVVAMLGAPYRTKTSSNGEKKFRYAHGQAKVVLGSVSSNYKVVDITFDRNGVVKEIDRVN